MKGDDKKTKNQKSRPHNKFTGRKPKADKGLKKRASQAMHGLDLLRCQRDLSAFLASTSDLMDGLKASLDTVLRMSGLHCGGIYLFDETGKQLNLRAHQGLSDEFVRAVSSYDQDSDNVLLVKSGKPTYVLYDDLKVRKVPVESQESILSIGVVPLMDGSDVIGCMNLGSKTNEDIPVAARLVIESTAAQIGSALARLKARDAVRESEEHLRSLMESASGFAVYRLAGDESTPNKLRVQFISPSAKDILGIPDPMQFESLFEHMHPGDVDRIIEANAKAFETMRFDEQFRIFHNGKGEWRWIHAIANATLDGNRWTGYVNGIMIDITERKSIEEKLKQNEIKLENRTRKLKESNTALKVLIRNREEIEKGIEDKIISSVNITILPYLNNLKKNNPRGDNAAWIKIIESNLKEIVSSFSNKLSSKHIGLSLTEIQVANLVKLGFSTKEIANRMNVSPKTTNVHRSAIRKKLGVPSGINLRSFLLSHFNG